MIHHTVSGDGTGIDDLCWNGRSDLPGPLCHGVIHKDGTVVLVGWGRANHAGLGDPDALAAVVAESTVHPAPNTASVDGNAHFVGFECVNWGNGKDPWPEVQLDAIARAAAAVCRYYGWGANSVIGHLEWTNQKIDPRGFTMRSLRDRIAARLAHTPGWNPGEDDDMPLNADDKKWIEDAIKRVAPAAVLTTDNIIPNPNSATAEKNPHITLSTAVQNNESVARRIDRTTAALTAQLAALTAVVGELAKGGGLDAAEIQAAAEAGAQAALDQLGDALTKEN